MTDKQFYDLWGAAQKESDRDAYVSDWSLSSMWGDVENRTDAEITDCAKQVGKIWDVAHMGISKLREASGLSQAEFALRFCIPVSTVRGWEKIENGRDDSSCASYVRLLIAQRIGLI